MFASASRSARAVAFSVATMAMAPLASAAIVTGSWDPPMVSPPFDGLGWATTINFSVPDDCLGSTGIINVRLANRSFRCSSPTPAITVIRAQIGLYDLATETYKYAMTLNASSLRPQILNISAAGEITYLYSLLPSDPVQQVIADEDLTINGVPFGVNYWFRLAMPGGAPVLQYSDTGSFFDFDPATAPGASPVLTSFRVDGNDMRNAVLDQTEIRVGRGVNQVPEPQSLALALLALAAAVTVTRRGSPRRRPAV